MKISGNELGLDHLGLMNLTNVHRNISVESMVEDIVENKEDYLNKKSNMKNYNYENTWNNINQKIITTINEN